MATEARNEWRAAEPASPQAREAFLRTLLANLDTSGTRRERFLRYDEHADRFNLHAHPWFRAYTERFGGTMGAWMLDLAAALNEAADEALATGNTHRFDGICDYLHASLFSTSATPLNELHPDEQLTAYERLRSRPALRENLLTPIGSTVLYDLTSLEDPEAFCLDQLRTAPSPASAARHLVTMAQLARLAHVSESTKKSERFCAATLRALRRTAEEPSTNPLLSVVARAEAAALEQLMQDRGPRRHRLVQPTGLPHPLPPLPKACPASIPTRIARDADGAIDPQTGLLDAIHGSTAAWQPVSAFARPLRPQDPEEGAALLQLIHQPEVREALETRIGVPMSRFSLREQAALMDFLGRQSPAVCERAFRVIQEGGPMVAQAFLACERQQRLGSLIINIAERAPREAAEPFFAQICSLVGQLDRSAETLAAEASMDPAIQGRIAESIHHTLLDRAVGLLSAYGPRLVEGQAAAREAIEAFKRVSNDTQLLASLFKAAARRGAPLRLEAFRDLRSEMRPLETLTDHERQQMTTLLTDQGFEKTAETLFPEDGETYDVFLLRHRETILGFIRFAQADTQGARHANFFCVAEAIRGSGIGEALAKEALDRAARTQPVRAEFASDSPIGMLYLEQFGFVGERIEQESVDGTEKTWIHIIRDPQMPANLRSRSASLSAIKRWADEHAPAGIQVHRILAVKPDITRICAEAWNRSPRALLTRYLTDPEDPRVRYLVFETPESR